MRATENPDGTVPVEPSEPVADRPVVSESVVGTPAAGTPVIDDDAPKHEAVLDDESAHQQAVEAQRDIVAREKEAYGGMKFGVAFFGWLTATGLAVILSALAAAVFSALGYRADAQSLQTASFAGAITLVVVLFIAYLAGGYVAGRMARFSGAKQGVAVWLWALIVTIIVTIIGLIAGNNVDLLGNLNSFPRLPFGSNMTVVGVISAVVLLAVTLIGAVLGGLAGMRFHRRVDRAGVGA